MWLFQDYLATLFELLMTKKKEILPLFQIFFRQDLVAVIKQKNAAWLLFKRFRKLLLQQQQI